jgi:hypothetical protein
LAIFKHASHRVLTAWRAISSISQNILKYPANGDHAYTEVVCNGLLNSLPHAVFTSRDVITTIFYRDCTMRFTYSGEQPASCVETSEDAWSTIFDYLQCRSPMSDLAENPPHAFKYPGNSSANLSMLSLEQHRSVVNNKALTLEHPKILRCKVTGYTPKWSIWFAKQSTSYLSNILRCLIGNLRRRLHEEITCLGENPGV